jgi:hypothetical protein
MIVQFVNVSRITLDRAVSRNRISLIATAVIQFVLSPHCD